MDTHLPALGIVALLSLAAAGAQEGMPELANLPYFAPQAMLEGRGDAYAKDQKISRADFGKSGLRGIDDLAGSWVLIEPITRHRSVEQHAELARSAVDSGLVVISVRTDRPSDSESTGPNHFVWHEREVAQDSAMGPFLLGRGYPSVMVIDPAGLLLAGGDELVYCGYRLEPNHGDVVELARKWPGLDVREEPPGSKLRKSIAKRDWKKALDKSESTPSHAVVDRVLDLQLRWAADALEQGDPIVARARLEALRKLPKGELQDRLTSLEAATKDDGSKAIVGEQEAVLDLARELTGAMRMGMARISEKDFDEVARGIEKVREQQLSAVPARMLETVEGVLQRYSPYQPCKGCGQLPEACKCG